MLKSLKPYSLRICEESERYKGRNPSCHIGTDIQFSSDELEQYCFSSWDSLIYDLFLLIASVEYCDRIVTRSTTLWGRRIQLAIPVHDVSRWRGEAQERLVEALNFLTGDAWDIHFRARKTPVEEPHQNFLPIRDKTSIVLPYSDGLDSRIVGYLTENASEDRLVRIRVTGHRFGQYRNGTKERPFASIPYKIKYRSNHLEPSFRSRGFKFNLLSAIASYLLDGNRVIVPESGQGALGPKFVQVGQAYPDYRNHPLFLKKLSTFFASVAGYNINFLFPRIWHTKAETLKDYIRLGGDDWANTKSCWRDNRHSSVCREWRHCGICAACLLRRLSVFAAGIEEDKATYIWYSLQSQNFESAACPDYKYKNLKINRTYAIAGVLHLHHLALLSHTEWFDPTFEMDVTRLAEALDLDRNNVERLNSRLWDAHANEWQHFLDSLGPTSFVVQWAKGLSQ